MSSLSRFVICATLLGATSASHAQSHGVGEIEENDDVINVTGTGHQKSFDCKGRKLEVEGTNHVVTMRGVCSSVEVSGDMNKVDVTIAPKGTLEVSGARHTVNWKSTADLNKSVSGAGHQVKRVQ